MWTNSAPISEIEVQVYRINRMEQEVDSNSNSSPQINSSLKIMSFHFILISTKRWEKDGGGVDSNDDKHIKCSLLLV